MFQKLQKPVYRKPILNSSKYRHPAKFCPMKYLVSPLSRFEVSKTFDLEAGLYYYIEALQAVEGSKQNNMRMGVVTPSGKTNFPVKKDLLCQFSPSTLKYVLAYSIIRKIKGLRSTHYQVYCLITKNYRYCTMILSN